MTGLADVISHTEAVSMFHLPRAGAPPTPGFRLHGLLVTLLRGWAIPVWWDHMLVGGDPWRSELAAALRDEQCRAVVVVLTERTAMSPWVEREVFAAKNQGRSVIPVQVRPAPAMDDEFQVVVLDGWYGDPDDCRLGRLRQAVAKALDAEDRVTAS